MSSSIQLKDAERFSFYVDWYDVQASLVRKYLLFYYGNGTVEMVWRACGLRISILCGGGEGARAAARVFFCDLRGY